MHVWLVLDPEDEHTRRPRVHMQTRPFNSRTDVPKGAYLRGEVREVREADVDDTTWADLLAARLTPEEQDQLHQQLWTASGPTPFPEVPA